MEKSTKKRFQMRNFFKAHRLLSVQNDDDDSIISFSNKM